MPVPIAIEKLTKRFGSQTVLAGIDLRIEAGELFFLLGPSGCGKTTLLRAVAGLNEPEEGRILAGDRDVTHLPPHRRDMGMVFHSYALWPHLTLRENVAFGLEMRGLKRAEVRARALRALELVKLADRANAKPNELSGGQQQRVALARALVIEPQCLLLDEPLSNLDAKLRLEMRAEIRRICKEAGLTAIYVTHDQEEALSIADRLAILDRGRLLQIGTPQEVYQRPASRFVAQFIGETTFVAGRVQAARTGQIDVETAAGTWRSAAAGAFAAGDAVWLSIRPEAVQMHAERTDAPTVFPRHCTGRSIWRVGQHFGIWRGADLEVARNPPRRVAARANARKPGSTSIRRTCRS
jgi:iron(III) transport system ATP-binding protein